MKPSYYVKLLELRSWREGGQANNVGYARRSLALGVIIEICFAVILLKIHNRTSLSPLSSAGEVLSCVGRVLGTQTCCACRAARRRQRTALGKAYHVLSRKILLDPELQLFPSKQPCLSH